MRKKLLATIFLCGLAALPGGGAWQFYRSIKARNSIRTGDTLRDIALISATGSRTSLQALANNRDLVIIFVNIHCSHCQRMICLFEEVGETGKVKLSLIVIANNSLSEVERWTKQTTLSFPVFSVIRPSDLAQLGVRRVPTVVVVKADNRVSYVSD